MVRVITHAKQASRFNVFHVQRDLPALDVITAHIVTHYTSEHKNSDVQSGEQHGHNTFTAGGGTDDALEERVRGGEGQQKGFDRENQSRFFGCGCR